jgi:hypothetical protein
LAAAFTPAAVTSTAVSTTVAPTDTAVDATDTAAPATDTAAHAPSMLAAANITTTPNKRIPSPHENNGQLATKARKHGHKKQTPDLSRGFVVYRCTPEGAPP